MVSDTNQPSKRKRSPIMIKKSTLIELLILLIATSILIIVLFSFNVNAQELASTANSTSSSEAAPFVKLQLLKIY